MTSEPSGELSWETREAILDQYVTRLASACRVLRIPLFQVSYSEAELRRSLDETDIDLQAMFNRRSRTNGISLGKISGILAYRLSRFKIIHLAEVAQNHKAGYIIQDVAALMTVEAIVLRKRISPRILLELAYQMSRRHANQETLGVIFDTL